MDTDTMDTKKKIYNTPELVEHGSLVEITQYNCVAVANDAIAGEGFSSDPTCL